MSVIHNMWISPEPLTQQVVDRYQSVHKFDLLHSRSLLTLASSSASHPSLKGRGMTWTWRSHVYKFGYIALPQPGGVWGDKIGGMAATLRPRRARPGDLPPP